MVREIVRPLPCVIGSTCYSYVMDDALLTDGPDADEMLSGLEADLAALVAAGELDAAEAREMSLWLGSPFAA